MRVGFFSSDYVYSNDSNNPFYEYIFFSYITENVKLQKAMSLYVAINLKKKKKKIIGMFTIKI